MSVLCEGDYAPMSLRSHIRQIVFDALDATLDKISEHPLPADHAMTVAYLELLPLQHTPISLAEIPVWQQDAINRFLETWWESSCYHESVEITTHPYAS